MNWAQEPDINEKTAPLSTIAVDPLVMRKRQREYIEAIKPFNDVKAQIYAFTIPTMIIHPSGQVEHRYNFTPEQQRAIKLADDAIDAVRAKIFHEAEESKI